MKASWFDKLKCWFGIHDLQEKQDQLSDKYALILHVMQCKHCDYEAPDKLIYGKKSERPKGEN